MVAETQLPKRFPQREFSKERDKSDLFHELHNILRDRGVDVSGFDEKDANFLCTGFIREESSEGRAEYIHFHNCSLSIVLLNNRVYGEIIVFDGYKFNSYETFDNIDALSISIEENEGDKSGVLVVSEKERSVRVDMTQLKTFMTVESITEEMIT